MRKYLDLTSWVLLFFFAPFTVLILLSQNTIPGDFFYPVKRGLENIILVAYSVSPSAKVGFRTDLTQRRFTEAQTLLVSKADTTAYNQFIDEVFVTSQDLSKLSNAQDKIESSEKLLAKIEEYQTQLTQVQNQVQIAQALPQPIETQPITPGEVPSQITQTQPTQVPSQTIQPTQQPTQSVTPTPISVSQSSTPVSVPSQASSSPPASSAPTAPPLAVTVTNQIANNPVKAEEVKEGIKKTQEHLELLKEKVKKEKEEAEVKEKVREEQKKLEENLKERSGSENNK